jgi:hypothetical protein
MKVTIDVFAGSDYRPPKKKDFEDTLAALNRIEKGHPLSNDDVYLIDVISIIWLIEKEVCKKTGEKPSENPYEI